MSSIDQTDMIVALFVAAIDTLKQDGVLPADFAANIQLTRTKDKAHGDFACNIAMMAAKKAQMQPRALAQLIIEALPHSDEITKIEVAGAGFINIFLNQDAKFAVIDAILEQKERFGTSDKYASEKIQVEFVSANPTSSLHVGHGRGAAFGMSLANILQAAGYTVCREYYVNDAGRQMDILATSTFLRYLQAANQPLDVFPSNAYQGEYVADFGRSLFQEYKDRYVVPIAKLYEGVPDDAVFEIKDGEKIAVSGDKEAHIDGLIANSKLLLAENYQLFLDFALNHILDDIREDLGEFGVDFKTWYSEKSLGNKVSETLDILQKNGHLYEKEGNIWFRSTDFGDEKDRVVRRANGMLTYFASDIAYHKDKFDRGFDRVIDVWGADHHGYIARVKAALTALGIDANRLEVILVQL